MRNTARKCESPMGSDHPHSRAEFTPADVYGFLANSGEMGARIRAFDWAKTPLGPAESWSPALRMMLRFLLANRFPLLLWWGPQYVSIYNDAYIPVLGTNSTLSHFKV